MYGGRAGGVNGNPGLRVTAVIVPGEVFGLPQTRKRSRAPYLRYLVLIAGFAGEDEGCCTVARGVESGPISSLRRCERLVASDR